MGSDLQVMSLNPSHCPPAIGDENIQFASAELICRTRIGGDAWLQRGPVREETEDYKGAILNGQLSCAHLGSRLGTGTLYTSRRPTSARPPATLTWRIAQIPAPMSDAQDTLAASGQRN